MADYPHIYEHQAEAYDRMVAAEDCDGVLEQTLSALLPPDATAIDVGAGTGRVTRFLLKAGARRVIGVEPAAGMLAQARAQQLPGAEFLRGRADALPVADRVADFVVAGWVFGHFTSWYPNEWRAHLRAALTEFDRVCSPNGTQVILDTMGTATPSAGPPSERLKTYYEELVSVHGFSQSIVSTDYLFDTPAEAAEAVGFFFGNALAERLVVQQERRIPEWTGVFTRKTGVRLDRH